MHCLPATLLWPLNLSIPWSRLAITGAGTYHGPLLSLLWLCVQGGNPFITPDSTVHGNPKTQNSDVELGQKPVTAPAEQRALS